MTYKEAKEIALQINPAINACKEYAVAYHFYDRRSKVFREGDDDVVILKETGKAVGYSYLIQEHYPLGLGKHHPF